MPNWCDLDVDIIGDKDTLEKIVSKGAEGTFKIGSDWNKEIMNYEKFEEKPNTFSFDNFFPTPNFIGIEEDKTKSIEQKSSEWAKGSDGVFDNWYDWNIGNWGTKWDLDQLGGVSITEIRDVGNGKFSFGIGSSTAWSPALEFFRKLSEVYDVRIVYQYAEEGMAFFGRAEIEGGEILSDTYREITSEDYKNAGAVLDEDGNVDWDKTDDYDLYKVL
jgi:hypothetical protein